MAMPTVGSIDYSRMDHARNQFDGRCMAGTTF